MVFYEEEEDNMCEGCMTRNTGENFSHPAMCKSCMGAMMDTPTDDVLKGGDKLTDRMAQNADAKIGALTTWRDTDGVEVEIVLPMPPGVTKRDVRVKCNVCKLLVATGEKRLLFVDPLYDDVVPDELVWCIERAPDGVTQQMQISLAKKHAGTRWGKTLSKEGGAFECWLNSALPAPSAGGDAAAGAPEALPAASLTKDGKPKPRFTMRDDGAEVEVNLPLPLGTGTGKKDVAVTASATSLKVMAGSKQLLRVEPLWAPTHPDDLVYTFDKREKGSGQVHLQLTLAKAADDGEVWTNIVKEGGVFECWTTEL